MKVTSTRVVAIGDESVVLELFESLTAPVSGLGPNFVRVRSSMGPTAPKTYGALDDDVVSVSHVGGSAAVVRLTKSNSWSERKVEPGATVFLEGNSEGLQTISCWSEGPMSVLAIATGRRMGQRQEMEMRTKATMQAAQERLEFLAQQHEAEMERQKKVAEEDARNQAAQVQARMAAQAQYLWRPKNI